MDGNGNRKGNGKWVDGAGICIGLEELTKRKGGLDSFNGLVIVFCLIYNF